MGLFKNNKYIALIFLFKGFLEHFITCISDLCLNFLGCSQLFIQQNMLQVQRHKDN